MQYIDILGFLYNLRLIITAPDFPSDMLSNTLNILKGTALSRTLQRLVARKTEIIRGGVIINGVKQQSRLIDIDDHHHLQHIEDHCWTSNLP